MIPRWARLTDGLFIHIRYDVDDGKLLDSVTLGTGHDL